MAIALLFLRRTKIGKQRYNHANKKKGRAMATPVPFKKVRRSIFRIFIGEVQELIGKRDAYDFSSMQKPRFKSRVMLLVRLMLEDIVGVIKMG